MPLKVFSKSLCLSLHRNSKTYIMQDKDKNISQEQSWHPPMNAEQAAKPAHPPELRFQEESRHNSARSLINCLKFSKLQIYDPIMREVLTDAMLRMDERITTLEERMCFFESSGAILQKSHMNAEEVARYLGYTRCAIYNLTRRKQIPFHKIRRHIFFDKQEIDEWIRKKRPTKWDELGVTPESIPIDFNETTALMKQRANLNKQDNSSQSNNNNTQ